MVKPGLDLLAERQVLVQILFVRLLVKIPAAFPLLDDSQAKLLYFPLTAEASSYLQKLRL